ncbi:unnamed protein product [Paramecium octaurelia]|uniref:RING-type E3 ubiquitin transferase n=1 Tax=Paramecium octaurelia TaxID=43137 RepID=A0A8S1U344_PAROT|nr:unnamed protein product [Paramecium octaurelia]
MSKQDEESKLQLIESAFECNICLEIATEPILTNCGHLFCWPCIFSWLNSNQEFLTCPVCKNGCSKNSLIPLYSKDEAKTNKPRDPNIPPRPKPGRNDPVRNNNQIGQNNLANGAMIAGYGLFPSLFNLICIKDGDIEKDERHENEATVEIENVRKLKAIQFLLILCLIMMIVFYF